MTPTGCAATAGRSLPGNATSRTVGDVDGDGRDDTLWITPAGPEITVGITTASGATFSHDASTAAPFAPSAVAIDPTGTGSPIDVIVSARTARVYTVSDCQLQIVTDPEGQPYVFGMGWSDVGTGMGCSTVADRTGLVGLDAKDDGDGSWTITRTQVLQTGTTAMNGASDSVKAAAGSAALKSALGVVSCGEVTLADDGVTPRR